LMGCVLWLLHLQLRPWAGLRSILLLLIFCSVFIEGLCSKSIITMCKFYDLYGELWCRGFRSMLKIEVFSVFQMGFGTSKNTSRKKTLRNIILISKCSFHLKSWINSTLQILFIISSSCLTPVV
jgi:hypothetical protein